jgi:GTP-binding protein Era
MTAAHRSGTVAIVGRPNVGKSTLLNRLIGSKVSITSAKAQTTRHRIVGVLTREDAQLAFLDTPGFQTRHVGALNQVLNRTVRQVLSDADVVVLVIDAAAGWTVGDARVLALIPADRRVILLLNKTDIAGERSALLPLVDQIRRERDFVAIIPVSAQRGTQLDVLVNECVALLPEGPLLYEADAITDRSERFLAAEALREKIFRLVGDELPYTTTVVIDQFEELPTLRKIHATVLVEREAHRPILLGPGGERMKRIGSEARSDLERLFGLRVHLEVWIKVKGGWADTEQSLRAYGYE